MDSNDKLKVVSVRKWQKHGGNEGRYVLRKETLTIIHIDQEEDYGGKQTHSDNYATDNNSFISNTSF